VKEPLVVQPDLQVERLELEQAERLELEQALDLQEQADLPERPFLINQIKEKARN
jgi:hypothetical protein